MGRADACSLRKVSRMFSSKSVKGFGLTVLALLVLGAASAGAFFNTTDCGYGYGYTATPDDCSVAAPSARVRLHA